MVCAGAADSASPKFDSPTFAPLLPSLVLFHPPPSLSLALRWTYLVWQTVVQAPAHMEDTGLPIS